MRGIGDADGGRLCLRARFDRLIQFPFLHCGLVTHGIRLRANFRSQAAGESSSAYAQFENGAQCARLRAWQHGEILRVAGGRGQEAAGGALGMDLRRLPSRKSRTPRRRRRPRRRSNSRSRSDRHRKSRARPRAAGVVLGVSGRGSDLPGVTTARMLEEMINGYEAALAGRFGGQAEKDHRPKLIREILDRAGHRKWRQLAEERIENVRPSIPLGKRFWALTKKERKALKDLLKSDGARELITALKGRREHDKIEVLDAAYWMKGCSSLGRLRYAVLVGVADGEPQSNNLCLIDIKEGVLAAAPRAPDAKMPRDNAERVVAGARALSPNLGERMMAGRLFDKSVTVRELMPQDLKIEINQLSREQATTIAGYLAGVVGRAHARQMDQATRRSWKAELARNRSKTLDAPSWLWLSVVELMASHEAAYLDHCRRYAWDEA